MSETPTEKAKELGKKLDVLADKLLQKKIETSKTIEIPKVDVVKQDSSNAKTIPEETQPMEKAQPMVESSQSQNK